MDAAVPRRIAQRTGAAVVLVDHVTKSTEGRGRFAIGAQAKMAALDGAAYSVEVAEPLGRGLRGAVRLWIGKDREGAVRPFCGRFRAGDRTQLAATVVIDSTSGQIVSEVLPPEELVGSERKPFRPTYLMEQISKALESNRVPVNRNALVKRPDFVTGKAEHKQTALRLLVDEGYVETQPGPNNALLHTSLRPYREADDPVQDQGTSRSSESASQPPDGSGSGSRLGDGEPGTSQCRRSTGSGNQRGSGGNHGNQSAGDPF